MKPHLYLSICCLMLAASGCASLVDESSVELDASVTIDASVEMDATAPVPAAVASFDCVVSPRSEMGASPDTTATFQIWLDGAELFTCHGANEPACRGFGGTPQVFECTTAQLSGGAQ